MNDETFSIFKVVSCMEVSVGIFLVLLGRFEKK